MRPRSIGSLERAWPLALCLCLSALTARAASPRLGQTAPQAAAASFATEPVVVRTMDLVFSYNLDGTGFREQTLAVAVQSDAALRNFSVLTTPFDGASERVHFRYARVHHPDGTVVETSPDAAFEQPAPVTQQAPLYSDQKQSQLPIKNLRVGDTLEWQVHIERFKAEALGEFWGRQPLLTDTVVLSEKIQLRVPASRPVTVWTNQASKLQPLIATQGEQKTYTWTTAALHPTVGAGAEAAKKVREKAILTAEEQIDAAQGKLPDVAWTTFPSWDAVGLWYRALEGDRVKPTPAITAKVTELTAGKATQEDKIRAVYAYVSGQVHYIGVDLGIGRFQPHHAGEVLDNQYGDCKDKHTLLAAMLAVLDVHADAVLIGSGIRFTPAVPSPDSFNHLITHIHLGSDEVWLDATQEVAPYRMLLAILRDKQALVVPDAGPASIQRTPIDPPFPTYEKIAAVGAIDKDGISESHFTMEQRGDEELLLRSVLRQITPAQYDELTQRLVASIGFGGTVNHARFLHVDDTAQPLVSDWDYHREKAGDDWGNLRTLPQLLITLLPTVDEKTPPTQDILLLGARTVTSTSELKLPAGWSAELPEAVHGKSAFGTYDLTFRYDKGTLYAERRWSVLKDKVPQADWKAYKKWTDEIALGSEPYVQLKTAASDKGKDTSRTEPPSSTKNLASQYIDDAYKAIQGNRLDEGAALLDKAKAISPQQQSLWGDYAWIAWKRGNHVEAMRLYRKEIDGNPDSLWAYSSLSQLQYMTGDRDGALATTRQLVAHAPESPDAATALIATLTTMHRNADAVVAVDAALTRLPADAQTNTKFQLAVVQAELRGGHIDAGVQAAVALLTMTTDSLALNNTAYELSVANQRLPLAESSQRALLEKLTAESQTWTLDEAPDVLRAKSSLLTAAWDTMGWILFRQGKAAEAEPYIYARWLDRPDAEVGQHLGEVQLAQGNKTAALHSFQMALATVPPYDALGVRRKDLSPEELELAARIRSLGGTVTSTGEAEGKGHAGLQAMRSLHLPSALGHDGVAEYRLLLSSKGVERILPATDKSLAGAPDLLLRAKLPPGAFPPASQARLVRLGMLNCHSGSCELVLLP